MSIKTYSKFSKTEGRAFTYLRWQGYQGGQWVQKHVGRAGVKELEEEGQGITKNDSHSKIQDLSR